MIRRKMDSGRMRERGIGREGGEGGGERLWVGWRWWGLYQA